MTGDGTVYFRAVGMLLDIRYSPRSCKEVQRKICLRAILSPGTAATNHAVAAVEIHCQFSAGRAAVADGTMFHKPPCTVDGEFVVEPDFTATPDPEV